MSLSRLLDVTGKRLTLLFTVIVLLCSPAVAQAQVEGMGYLCNLPQLRRDCAAEIIRVQVEVLRQVRYLAQLGRNRIRNFIFLIK